MGRLYINDMYKNESQTYRVIINGADMTDAYRSGELQGIQLDEGYYDIAIFEGVRRYSYLAKPKNKSVYIGQNEDVSLLIEVSKLDIVRVIAQKVFYFGICLMLVLTMGIRFVLDSLVQTRSIFLLYILYLILAFIFLLMVSGAIQLLLGFYLLILQNKYRLVETSRMITQSI